MSDAWLIFAVFGFIFLLWLTTGGPTRPISFAGPYITPLTTSGDVQVGYGPDINVASRDNSGYWSVRSVLGGFENRLSGSGPVSSQVGEVSITSGSGGPSASDKDREYVTIRSRSDTAVNITGWKLVSGKSGAEAVIQAGAQLASIGPSSAILLAPGDEAIIVTGSSPVGGSFRENKCIGYVSGVSNLTPSPPTRSCPAPLDELGTYYGGSAEEYDACRVHVSEIPRCTSVNAPREASLSCREFTDTRLNYAGCVAGHQYDTDFYGDTWRIFLGRGSELWRIDNEIIRLHDSTGKVVDVYAY